MTAHIALLSAMLAEDKQECEASNEYRETLVEAKRLALERLAELEGE